MQRRIVAGAIVIAIAGPREARAEDLFEIQVFHARVVEAGHLDVELHSNYAALGPAIVPAGEVSTDRVLYEMIEPGFGIAPGWEIAGHIQQALVGGVPVWGGEKLRVMGVLPTTPGSHWRFAANVEGGYQPARFDPARWGLEVRPVVEWTCGPFDLDFNPIVTVPFGAIDPGVPQLQPAISARLLFSNTLQPSLEYYAQFGPVTHIPAFDEQRHYVFETVDVVRWPSWILHGGIGEGLTSVSTRFIVTTMLGHIF